ncbi:hypothetical protein [Embleya sp. NBC_00896]|uniref:hypothetical protein n=1 Tax=Embleya sp. NBC_00896 TaxID=2975961 RepID=UPI002F9163EF|nr:hypothetical protein OG928_47305 [Embleya sp. NBC_00896]
MSRDAEIIVLARDAEAVMEHLTTDEFAQEWGGHKFFPIDNEMFRAMKSGSKLCYMWIIQFTRQNWYGIFEYLQGIEWPDPHSVQVLVRDQDDDCFGLWMIFNGKLTEVTLPATERTDTDYIEVGCLSRTDRTQGT